MKTKMAINNTEIQLQLTDPLVRTWSFFPAPNQLSFLQLAHTFVEIVMAHYHVRLLSIIICQLHVISIYFFVML
jgi:hypothetical protein